MPLVSAEVSEQLVCVMLTIAGSAGLHRNLWVIQNTFLESPLYKSCLNGKSCDSLHCVLIISRFDWTCSWQSSKIFWAKIHFDLTWQCQTSGCVPCHHNGTCNPAIVWIESQTTVTLQLFLSLSDSKVCLRALPCTINVLKALRKCTLPQMWMST